MSVVRRAILPTVGFAGPVLAAVACYGATEVVVEVSTDLGCDTPIRTALFKGEPYGSAPVAETPTCAIRPGADAEIGTLVFVPSGSTEGRAAVKAVLARGSTRPDECEAKPRDCIVAQRSFSFVSHASRRVPIRLLRACLGTRCPAGQTCVAGGRCVSDQVSCSGADCGLVEERDAGPGPADAGDDGPSGEGGPGGVCGGPNGNGIFATAPPGPPNLTLAHGGGFYFYRADLRGQRIVHIPKDASTKERDVFDVGGAEGSGPLALGRFGSAAMVARIRAAGPSNVYVLQVEGNPVTFNVEPTFSAFAANPEASIIYVAYDGGISRHAFLADPQPFTAATKVKSLAVDATAIFAAGALSTQILDREEGRPVGTVPIGDLATSPVLFTYDGEHVFAAGRHSSGEPVAMRLERDTPELVVEGMDGSPTSLAVDDKKLYWTDGVAIRSHAKVGGRTVKPASAYVDPDPAARLRDVAVDDTCLYFWRDLNSAAVSELRGVPKPP